MTWTTTQDVEEYVGRAGHLLADPVAQTVACTVVENNRAKPDGTVFAWWTDAAGAVRGAASVTPPYPLLLVEVPEAAVPGLVDLVVEERMPASGLNGAHPTVATVAATWRRRTGRLVELVFANRLYALTSLVDPAPVPGAVELLDPQDAELGAPLMEAFLADTGVPRHDDPATLVRDRASSGAVVLWRDERGRAVALAAHTRPASGVVRVGPVVTDPEERGKGYGAAVTAAVVRRALDGGARGVVLFTDLANPTSNALYQRLGFAPVGDRLMVTLHP